MSDTEPVLIETGERLSRSRLWQWQRSFFVAAGPAAWSRGIVPQHITSNPWVARVYVELLTAWLRDLVGEAGRVDRAEPLYVIELGAGSGRLAFHCLQGLQQALGLPVFAGLRVVYVMTDFHPAALAAWHGHPQLAPFVAAGQLDFAVFDAGSDDSLRLEVSGRRLAADGPGNPIAALANYVFDGLPCDLFRVVGGAASAMTVDLKVPAGLACGPEHMLLERVELEFRPGDAARPGADEPALARLLAAYARELGDTHLLLPVAALRCVEALRRLAGGHLLLLAADKGYHRLGDLLFRGEPELARHGSVSMMVNFHALDWHARATGGELLGAAHGHTSLDVCALHFGGAAPELRAAWRSRSAHQHPDDFSLLRGALAHERLSLAQMLAALRWSGWDHVTFLELFTPLTRALAEATEGQRAEVADAADAVWRHYFHLGETVDLAHVIGVLHMNLGRHAEALRFFARSQERHEATALLHCNVATCERALGRPGAAMKAVEAALALAPEFAEARALRIQLREALARRAGGR